MEDITMAKKHYEDRNLKFETLQLHVGQEQPDPVTDARAVSHHLKLLKKSGLITSRREGKEIYYKLADSETAQLLHHIIEEMFRITCPLN